LRVTVIGAGYVGLVTAACTAEWGHDVVCIDIDHARVEALRIGQTPIFEPGLDELVVHGLDSGRLHFASDYDAVAGSDVVFIAVGTPSEKDGQVDLSAVRAVAASLAPNLDEHTVVVVKSTVPVGTTQEIGEWLQAARPDLSIHVASNPEFLRQGAAVHDFMAPDRVVIGASDPTAEARLVDLYQSLQEAGTPVIATQIESAELAKYASNAFLAIKLSFVNEIADLSEASGANVADVTRIMGLDGRIGSSYLAAGPGFGGSCLPKDVQGLLHTSERFGAGSTIAAAALGVNDSRKHRMADKVEEAVGGPLASTTIAILGLTFKAGTDDLRHSPAIELTDSLVARGAAVRAHDPKGMPAAKSVLPPEVELCPDPMTALTGADAMVIATEWPEYAALDLTEVAALLARPVVVDLRNLLDPVAVTGAGLSYASIGRAPAT